MRKVLTTRITRNAEDKSVGQIMLTDNESTTIHGFYKVINGKVVFIWSKYGIWKGFELDKQKVADIIGKAEDLGMFDNQTLKDVLDYDKQVQVSRNIETEEKQES